MFFDQKIFICLFIWALVGIKAAFYYPEVDDAPNRDPKTKDMNYNDTIYCLINRHHVLCRTTVDKKALNPLLGELDEDCKPKSVLTYMPSSVEEREYITKLFNEKRQAVAQGTFKFGDITLPKAADMRKLKWCYFCEQAALNHVKYCKDGPNECCGSNKFDEYEVNYRILEFPLTKDEYDTRFKLNDPNNKPYTKFWKDMVDLIFKPKNADPSFSLPKIDTTTDPFFGRSESLLSMYLRSEISLVGLKMAILDGEPDNMKILRIMLVFGGFSSWKNTPMYKQGEGCSKCASGDKCDKDTSLCDCDPNCFKNESDSLGCYVKKPAFCQYSLQAYVLVSQSGLDLNKRYLKYIEACMTHCNPSDNIDSNMTTNRSNTIKSTTTSKPDVVTTTTETTTTTNKPDVVTTTTETTTTSKPDVVTTTTETTTTTEATTAEPGTEGPGPEIDTKGGAEIHPNLNAESRSTSGTESNHRRPDKTLIIDFIFSLTIQLVSWAFTA